MTWAALTRNSGWLLLRNGCVSPKRKLLSSLLSGWKSGQSGQESGQEALPCMGQEPGDLEQEQNSSGHVGGHVCGQ